MKLGHLAGGCPPEIADQLEIGKALLQTGQQQLPLSGTMPSALRLLETAAAANSAVLTPASELPNPRCLLPPAPSTATASRLSTRPPQGKAASCLETLQVWCVPVI